MTLQAFSLSVPADSRYLKAIRAFFESALGEACGEEAEMVILAVDESCSNVLKHRQGGARGDCLQVEAELGPELLRFRVRDFCGPADVLNIKPRDLKAVRPGGLGTHFVGCIMDRVEFEPDREWPGRLMLVLEKKLPARPAAREEGRSRP